MKKIWCNFLGCLLIGLFTCNVAMNILTYNLWYKTFFIDKMFMSFENNWIVVSIAVVAFLVISIGINFSSMYLFNRLSQKHIAKITDEKQKSKMKKISRIFIIINILLYVLCISKWFIDITQYDYDFLNYAEYLEDKDVDIRIPVAVLAPVYMEVVNVIILVCFIVMNLLAIFPIKNTFKIDKKKKSVLANILIYAYLFLFVVFSISISAYYYIDIPEFNYIYEFKSFSSTRK